MAKVGVVKMSVVTANGGWMTPGTALRVKERLDARRAQETPEEARVEIATMKAEAQGLMKDARAIRAQANEMLANARELEEQAAVWQTRIAIRSLAGCARGRISSVNVDISL